MKKTVALIYRLIFILISVWALWSHLGIPTMKAFSDLSVFSDIVNALTALAVFLWSIKSAPPEAVLKMKAVFAAVAAAVLFANRSFLLSPVDLWWIINVLLPALAVLDWLLFDKKGLLKIWDLLLWLLAALGLMALLGFGLDSILSALLPALVFSGLVLLLGNLFSGKKKRSLSLLLQLCFLALECYAFYLLSGLNVESFVGNLKYYTPIANLFAFSVVAVSVIVNFLGFKKAGTYLSRIKGCAVVLLVIAGALYYGYFKGSPYVGWETLIHSIICPAFLLIDYLVFDSKENTRGFDPLWWCLPVFGYSVFYMMRPYPYILYDDMNMMTFVWYGILALVVGYILFAVDKLVKRFN